jgi:hypothetical protein
MRDEGITIGSGKVIKYKPFGEGLEATAWNK